LTFDKFLSAERYNGGEARHITAQSFIRPLTGRNAIMVLSPALKAAIAQSQAKYEAIMACESSRAKYRVAELADLLHDLNNLNDHDIGVLAGLISAWRQDEVEHIPCNLEALIACLIE
jgi:hypothetical protein